MCTSVIADARCSSSPHKRYRAFGEARNGQPCCEVLVRRLWSVNHVILFVARRPRLRCGIHCPLPYAWKTLQWRCLDFERGVGACSRRESLPALLADGFQILKPGGLAIHASDYSDHFARGTDVSRYNFLQYSSARWRTFNSRIQFVNRLRHSEYLNLFRAAGFELVEVNEHSGEIPRKLWQIWHQSFGDLCSVTSGFFDLASSHGGLCKASRLIWRDSL